MREIGAMIVEIVQSCSDRADCSILGIAVSRAGIMSARSKGLPLQSEMYKEYRGQTSRADTALLAYARNTGPV
jgi:hypothetical protein